MSAEDRRKRQKAARRQAIKLAAVRLALDRGLDALTVEAISEAADISPRTFFNYFSAKEDALVMEPSWTAEELGALLAARPRDEPAVRSMRALAKEIAESYVPAREEIELWRRHPELLSRARPGDEERIFMTLSLAVGERMGADAMRDVYPSVLVTMTISTIQWAVRASWATDGARSVDALIDEAFDLLERGL
ncbi:TetR/AcrR family transcriptional regulator [Herbidospora mongoliensis]|uniref:TetR/AcrR family transcriptional regulator n=1 Tax=Herbidospora mongoliensis TaxID=688067 RepID=UPI000A04EFCF|nr:TetR/AcrR family transcriptional regulator [Herbidospora mongoliensis]